MVYEFLAEGFEEIEAITPIDLLRRAGVEVTSVGVTGKEVTGAHSITVEADITIDDFEVGDDIEMIILPGGNPGYKNLESNNKVKQAIDYCFYNKRYVGAICAAPSILGRFGLLNGLRATVYPGMEDELIGAKYEKQEVVKDGYVITSRGAGTAIPFSAELITVMVNKEKAKEILDSIVYDQ